MYSGILLKSMLLALAIAVLGILAGYPLAYMLSLQGAQGEAGCSSCCPSSRCG